MGFTDYAKTCYENLFSGAGAGLPETDPEFVERFAQFAFGEVPKQPGQGLDDKTRCLAILATLLGCQGLDAFRALLPAALDLGVTPVEAKEVVY